MLNIYEFSEEIKQIKMADVTQIAKKRATSLNPELIHDKTPEIDS